MYVWQKSVGKRRKWVACVLKKLLGVYVACQQSVFLIVSILTGTLCWPVCLMVSVPVATEMCVSKWNQLKEVCLKEVFGETRSVFVSVFCLKQDLLLIIYSVQFSSTCVHIVHNRLFFTWNYSRTERWNIFNQWFKVRQRYFKKIVLGLFLLENSYCFTGFRFAPVISTVDEEVESHHLKFLAVPPGRTVFDILNKILICLSILCLFACLSVPLSICFPGLMAHLHVVRKRFN